MPASLSQLKTRILSYLIDATGINFTDSTLTEGIHQALDQYTIYLPLTIDTVITLPGDGAEVALNAFPDLVDLLTVHYPYDSTLGTDQQPSNQVTGWYLWHDDTQPLVTIRSRVPLQLNTEMRLCYTQPNTISGLDGSAITTLASLHESAFVRGAAGYAAMSRSIDKVESRQFGNSTREPDQIGAWADKNIASYILALTNLKHYGIPSAGHPAWSMDAWDSNQ
jgi:hypothetical protein